MRHTSSRSITASLAHIAVVTITLTGCPGMHTQDLTGDPGGGYQSQQGIWLHGTVGPSGDPGPPPFEGIRADLPLAGATARDGRPYTSLGIAHGQLQGTL